MYQDSWQLMKNMTDDQITLFYKAIQNATGYSIRYYGTEQYDTQIFGVFTFLTDRGFQGFGMGLYEDDYYVTKWKDMKTNETFFSYQLEKLSQQEYEEKDLQSYTDAKELMFNTMWYKTYWGYGQFPDNRMPTYLLSHFKLVYYSPIVVISKYYEGATITGNIKVGDQPFPYVFAYVFDEYGIPHGYGMTDANGSYSLIAPAGNMTIKLFTSTNTLDLTQNITITEEEGRRNIPCNKSLSFDVNWSTLNVNVTTNQTGLTLLVEGQEYQQTLSNPIFGNNTFNFATLIPQDYKISIIGANETSLYNATIFTKPGLNYYNVKL
jgi:hypothetical protein